MGRAAVAITLSVSERRELDGLARRRKTAQGLARRARIVLAAADGLENKAIVEQVPPPTRTARSASGVGALPSIGRPLNRAPAHDRRRIAEIIGLTLEQIAADREGALEPAWPGLTRHRPSTAWRASACSRTARPSNLSTDPPIDISNGEPLLNRAGAVCGREEPDPALGPHAAVGPCGPRSSGAPDDYIRHGPPSLGHRHRKVIGQCFPRHRSRESNSCADGPRRPSGDGQPGRDPQDPGRPSNGMHRRLLASSASSRLMHRGDRSTRRNSNYIESTPTTSDGPPRDNQTFSFSKSRIGTLVETCFLFILQQVIDFLSKYGLLTALRICTGAVNRARREARFRAGPGRTSPSGRPS